jgi:type I restriction enzyme S subunit
MVRLGDIATYINGYAFKPTDWSSEGVPIIRIQDLTGNSYQANRYNGKYDAKYEVNYGDVLISWSASLGVYVWEGEKAVLNQHIFKVQFDKVEVDKNFFVHQVERILNNASGEAHGATMKHLTKPVFDSLPFYLPNIEEQKKIANELNKVSNLISLRKQQLSKLDELVKSRFIEMFGSEENKIPISEMCNVTGGYSFKSDDISDDGAIKILQIGNVYLDNVSWETTNYLPEGFDEKYSKFMLNEGDIVVALTRPIIQSLGNVKACIVKSSDLPCLLNQRVGRIVAKKEKSVFLDFIYGCLMTDDFTRYVETYSIGCSQPNISTKDIENFLIPNATYEEQKVYVEFKKQTDKSKFEIQKSLEKLETLKKALMQKYFR